MKKILPIIIPVVLSLGIGFFLFGGSSDTKAAKPDPAAEAAAKEEAAKAEEGGIYDIPSITMNLADGHFLKLGLSLQLTTKVAEPKEFETKKAKALDIAIDMFGRSTMAELGDPEKRAEMKKELSEKIIDTYKEKGEKTVLGVYFTEFVMQ